MSTDDPAARSDVVFTPGRGYRAPLLRRAGIFLVLTVIAAFLGGSGFVPPLAWAAAALLGAAALTQGTLYLWQGRFRTRLSATGIEARGYFGHFIPWLERRYRISQGVEPAGHLPTLNVGCQKLRGQNRIEMKY
jgi:hypothetical protein